MEIQLSSTILRRTADDLNAFVEALEYLDNGINKVQGDIGLYWQSEYTDLYLEYLMAVRDKVKNLLAESTDIQRELKRTADRVEETERKVQQVVNNIVRNLSDSTGLPTAVAGVAAAQDAISKNE